MMTFLTYQLKVAVIMAVFYIFYRLFLSKDTWHRLNRIVLLCTALLSFLLPVCIITLHKTQVIHITDTIEPLAYHGTAEAAQSDAPWWHIALASAYLAGVAFVLFRIAASILRVRRIISNARKEMLQDGTCVYVMEGDAPSFSWMGHIVISQSDWHCGNPGIIRHEKAHVALHHSIDVLVTDIASAVQWFNPAIWMLRTDLRAVHEYEADDAVLRSGTDLRSYQYLLISKAAAMNGYTIANNFNHSILKNRIFMMEKETSTRRSLLRALYLLPLVCICLAVNAKMDVSYVYEFTAADEADSTAVSRIDSVFLIHGLEPVRIDREEKDGQVWQAEAYRIPESMSMDSLIHRLPGVEIEQDGNMTVNGKRVSRILMNGQAVDFGDVDSSYYQMKLFIEENIQNVNQAKTVAARVQTANDTINFNSANYKLPDGESVEDLIKKLPGVGIDDDSSITVNGKPVSKVLVNGESYYPNFVNDKVSYDTDMEKEESSIGLWDKSIHVDYYKKCLTAIGITDDIYSLIVVPSGGGRVAEIKLGTKDEAIKAIENMISSYKTGNTLEIDGYTINGIKGKVYSISHTGPLERAISGSNYIFRIKGLKKVL